jgi:hypothetical protein
MARCVKDYATGFQGALLFSQAGDDAREASGAFSFLLTHRPPIGVP